MPAYKDEKTGKWFAKFYYTNWQGIKKQKWKRGFATKKEALGFEEFGVPFTPFHGGFGLVANGCIPKPTFWTFAFFKKLKEKKGICVYKNETCVVMKYEDGSYRGIAWNATRNRSGKDLCLNLTIPTTQSASTDAYLFLTQTVDEDTCNPLKTWHDMGEPANPAKDQIDLLKQTARPQIRTERIPV